MSVGLAPIGDGSKTRAGVVSLEQTSAQLHWQMRTLAARSQSAFVGCYQQPVLSENHAQSYRANFSPPDGLPHRKTLDDVDYVYEPVSDVVRQTYSGDVYNFEVEEDHSYVTDFAVHNCDRELISELHEEIIATTGCPSGEVQTRLRLRQYKEVLQAASDYKDISIRAPARRSSSRFRCTSSCRARAGRPGWRCPATTSSRLRTPLQGKLKGLLGAGCFEAF